MGPAEHEHRPFPRPDVARLRRLDERRVVAFYAAVFFAGAVVWRCGGCEGRSSVAPTDDPKAVLLLIAFGAFVAYLTVSLWRAPLDWPCPGCGGRAPRAARQTRLGTVLRHCRRCRVDWDTGEDPFEGGSGQSG